MGQIESSRALRAGAPEDATLAEARRALQTAVINVERVRTHLRSDSTHVTSEWKRLGSMRWTLVDEVDAHGAKYIVARQPAAAAGLSTLTRSERRVVADAARGLSTKEISYGLGIAEATVRVLIMRAVRRCGVRTRNELLALAKAASAEIEASQPTTPGA
jgi:DNA-binding CsgD family transcriptional regulator